MNKDEQAKKIKIIFIGTADFGLPSLDALIADPSYQLLAVITSPDKATGRHQLLTPSPIKILALKYKLPILQPKKIGEITEKIKLLKPDLIIVIAYKQLLPPAILAIPPFGCLNIHPSLLPKYRGAAVVQAAILNYEQNTGITIFKMDEGLDSGPILAQSKIKISANETSGSLYHKLANLAGKFLPSVLEKYLAGKIEPLLQDRSQASYLGKLTKADGLIDWSKPANEIATQIRAMMPWPLAWTWWQGRQIKILEVQQQTIGINSYKVGKTFKYNNGLAVQTGHDVLIIRKLQLEGKKVLTSEDFIRGQRDFIGAILG